MNCVRLIEFKVCSSIHKRLDVWTGPKRWNTSVNSMISMPSVVYQWRNALLLNIAENCSVNLLNASWMAVLLYRNVAAVFCPLGGTLHTAVFMLFGIQSTNADECAFCISEMVSSTSLMASWPLNMAAAVRYRPCLGSQATIMFWGPNILLVSSEMAYDLKLCEPWLMSGAWEGMKKWRRGNGTMFTASFLRSALSCQDRGQWINCKTSHMHSFWRLSSQTSFITAIKLQSHYHSFAGQRYFWPTPLTESSGLKLPWARESKASADLSTLWKRV